jgi:DnaA family protein
MPPTEHFSSPAESRAGGQLALDIGLADEPSFDNFIGEVGGEASHIVHEAALRRGAKLVYLFGSWGSGRTHLLCAAVRAASAKGARVATVPLTVPGLTPQILEGLEDFDLVCLDDLDVVAGQPVWERALFNFYNVIERSSAGLITTALTSPGQLPVHLPDLASRFSSGVTVKLTALDEGGCRRALKARAHQRGFELGDDVLEFVLRRVRRDMHSLVRLLDRLDASTLTQKRRVTVPFVRSILDAADAQPGSETMPGTAPKPGAGPIQEAQ